MTLTDLRKRTIGRVQHTDDLTSAWMEMDDHPAETAREPHPPGTMLLIAAAGLLLILAVAQGYVSWRAQYTFIYAAKHASVPSALEAIGLDTGAVIFALLGLAHARMGRSARIERTLNLACAFGSMTMNLLGADLTSPRSIAVYVLPALLYAACSDRLIATAGHAAGVADTSLWHFAGLGLLYGLRACLAFPSTATGLRLRLLELTPLPEGNPRIPDMTNPGLDYSRPAMSGSEPQVTDSSATRADRPESSVILANLPNLLKLSDSDSFTATPEPDHATTPNGTCAITPEGGLAGADSEKKVADLPQAATETKKAHLLRLYAAHPDRGARAKVSKVAGELAPQVNLNPGSARTYLYAEVDRAAS